MLAQRFWNNHLLAEMGYLTTTTSINTIHNPSTRQQRRQNHNFFRATKRSPQTVKSLVYLETEEVIVLGFTWFESITVAQGPEEEVRREDLVEEEVRKRVEEVLGERVVYPTNF